MTTAGVPTRHVLPISSHHRDGLARIKKNVSTGLASTITKKSPFHADLATRIPRAEVARHVAFVTRHAKTAMAAGSYRRGAADSADIDIVIREPIADVLARLTAAGYIHHVFGAGPIKFSGVVRLPAGTGSRPRYRHLDLVATTPRAHPFAMLYFTGPARLNIIMRVKAKRLGLKLNEYGLWRVGTAAAAPVPNIHTERDIFAALGMTYVEPAARG